MWQYFSGGAKLPLCAGGCCATTVRWSDICAEWYCVPISPTSILKSDQHQKTKRSTTLSVWVASSRRSSGCRWRLRHNKSFMTSCAMVLSKRWRRRCNGSLDSGRTPSVRLQHISGGWKSDFLNQKTQIGFRLVYMSADSVWHSETEICGKLFPRMVDGTKNRNTK